MSIFKKDKLTSEDKNLASLVRGYLQGGRICWRSSKGVKRTVVDVLRLDDDLKVFVRESLERETVDVPPPTLPEVDCSNITIVELLEVFESNPISAALWVQWYREEPVHALASLCMRGGVEDLPEPTAKDKAVAAKESVLGKLVVDSPIEKMVPTKNGPVPISQFGSVGKKYSDRFYKHGIR